MLIATLGACASLGAGKWSAYSMTVQINDSAGSPLAGVKVSSIDNETRTNEQGSATLYYRTKGLYVITVQAAGMETTQIKVTVPADMDKVIAVHLSPIQSSTP